MATRVDEKRQKRRPGFPWWLAALLALALIAIVIALLFAFDVFDRDEQSAGSDPAATADTTQDGGGVVNDLGSIFGADASALTGRRVDLEGAQVQSVVGDKTFWIGPSEEQQVFVFLEESGDATGVEGNVDVNAGQTITLTGTVERVPQSPQDEFDLSNENTARLANEQVYIRAAKVDITG